VPLWANIQEGLTLLADSDEKRHLPKTVQIVEMAKRTAIAMKGEAYLVLDAYFAVGPVFLTAAEQLNGVSNFVHILTRAKKTIVAYGKPPKIFTFSSRILFYATRFVRVQSFFGRSSKTSDLERVTVKHALPSWRHKES